MLTPQWPSAPIMASRATACSTVEVWRSGAGGAGNITVTLTFTPPGPAMMHYATVVGFEDEAP